VSLSHLTKQLAQQAIGQQVKDVVESLGPQSPPIQAQAENVGAAILAQVQAMQNALKEDQELLLACFLCGESMRVLEVYAPTWRVLVLTGVDPDRTVTRVICPVETVQLICKPVPVQPGAKPVRVRIVAPKS
jgi:hypothetical protein